MRFEDNFVRMSSGVISTLTGKRFATVEECRADNRAIENAANQRAAAAGAPNPTARQIQDGTLGIRDSRSVNERIADQRAAEDPTGQQYRNPYKTAREFTRAMRYHEHGLNPARQAEDERLAKKEKEYESRREKLAALPPKAEQTPPDPLRDTAAMLRQTPRRPGESDWREKAADAIDARADRRDAAQRVADAEQARLEDGNLQRALTYMRCEVGNLEHNADAGPQEWLIEARQKLVDLEAGRLDPLQFWSVDQPIIAERHAAQKQTRVDAETQRHDAEIQKINDSDPSPGASS